MDTQKNCLILMPLGSEVRQFGHAGMIAELIKKGWRVIVAAKLIDDDLRNQLAPGVVFIPLIREFPPVRFGRVQEVLNRAHQVLEARRDKKQWQYVPDRSRTLAQQIKFWILDQIAIVVGFIPNLYSYLAKYEQHLEAELISPAWLELFRKFNITVLVLNVPNINSLTSALATARAQNIPCVLFFHTFKDVTVNGRLSHKYTIAGVWNVWMKQELLRKNPDVDAKNIRVVGCAHFDCVGRSDLLLPQREFRQKIGAKPKSKLALFPASAQWVVPEEGRYVWLLVEAVRKGIIDPDLQIIIRKNPMDETMYWETEFEHCEQVIVLKSDWRWDARQNWCFQRYNDMILYNSLLHYSIVCVGVPSTITIECAISNLPVINIGFDLTGPSPLPGSMRAFWEADFYKDIVQNNLALLASNEKELELLINNSLNKRDDSITENFLHSQILGVFPPNATQEYIDVLEDILEDNVR